MNLNKSNRYMPLLLALCAAQTAGAWSGQGTETEPYKITNASELKQLKDFFSRPEDEFSLDPSFEFTNTPKVDHELIQPFAKPENVQKFKFLQKMVSVGLVEPVGEEHMYFAAMHSKSCRLTPLGKYYLHLAQKDRI